MTTTRRAAATALLILLSGCSDSADPVAAPQSPAPRDRMSFTFTGAPGDAGCRYDGPRTLGTDPVSTLVNSSDAEAYVTLAPLKEGSSPQDFEAYVDSIGQTYPVRVPAEDHDPAAHAWLDGGWRQVHTTAAGQTQEITSTVFREGEYVMFCFRDAEGGSSDLWPLGSVTVTDG